MPELYFKNTKTGKKFKIVKMDAKKGEVTLKGEYHEFVDKFEPDRFKRLGYVLVGADGEAVRKEHHVSRTDGEAVRKEQHASH